MILEKLKASPVAEQTSVLDTCNPWSKITTLEGNPFPRAVQSDGALRITGGKLQRPIDHLPILRRIAAIYPIYAILHVYPVRGTGGVIVILVSNQDINLTLLNLRVDMLRQGYLCNPLDLERMRRAYQDRECLDILWYTIRQRAARTRRIRKHIASYLPSDWVGCWSWRFRLNSSPTWVCEGYRKGEHNINARDTIMGGFRNVISMLRILIPL